MWGSAGLVRSGTRGAVAARGWVVTFLLWSKSNQNTWKKLENQSNQLVLTSFLGFQTCPPGKKLQIKF